MSLSYNNEVSDKTNPIRLDVYNFEALNGVFGRWEIGLKKVGDLGDWSTNKVGDGIFGYKMGAGAGRLRKYALGAGRLDERKVGDWEIWTPPIEGLNFMYGME